MTQFVLCQQNEQVDLRKITKIAIQEDKFLKMAASKLFKSCNYADIFSIKYDGKDFDEILTSAQVQIVDGDSIIETDLFDCINILIDGCDCLAFWYGSDWEDLDYIGSKEELLRRAEEALQDSSCELYLHYEAQQMDRNC